MKIVCAHKRCRRACDKPTGAVNRARKIGAPIYCSRLCAGMARRGEWKSPEQRKAEKAAYDANRRLVLRERIKREKAAYFQRTYDPVAAAIKRKERMPRHVEYCRQPQYRAKKAKYDRKRRAAEFGDFADAYLLLLGIDQEITERTSRYEIYQENGRLARNSQKRKRAAAAGSIALG